MSNPFKEYWKAVKDKPPYTPEAIAEHAWNAAKAHRACEDSDSPEAHAQRLLAGYQKGLKGEDLREYTATGRLPKGYKAEMETSTCTLCADAPSDGFYTGCMINDGQIKNPEWKCDGKGNLSRPKRN